MKQNLLDLHTLLSFVEVLQTWHMHKDNVTRIQEKER